MSVRALLASRRTTRASALVLAVCLGLFALLGAAAPAEDAGEEPPFRFTGRFGQGVCDTLWVWAHRLDEASQDVLTEQALHAARQADAASAADAAAQAQAAELSEDERYGDEVAASRAAQAEAEAEALHAADVAAADGDAAASGSSHESSEAPASSSQEAAVGSPANLICFLGEEVPYRQGGPADTSAPEGYASTWVGTGRVSDNANTYFIGHNPGVFARVMDLDVGDKITVFDDTGASRTYYVFDTLFLPNRSNYFVYEGRIAPDGETITLQTCTGDNQRVRCVMAR